MYIALLGLLLFPACQNNQSEEASAEEVQATLVEETEIDEVPNISDLELDEAIAAFLDGDNTAASAYIEQAVTDIEEEGEELTGNHKTLLEMAVGNLNTLADKVKQGEVKDEAELNKVFANAEMNVAHAYLTFTDVYALESPENARGALEKAIARMESASARLEGRAKTEAEDMIREGKAFLKKEDTKANDWGNATGHQINKMTGWLQQHS